MLQLFLLRLPSDAVFLQELTADVPYIEPVEAFKVVLLDFRDVVVLQVDHRRVFRNLLRNRNQTCRHKHNR